MRAFFIRLAELLLVNCILSAIVAAAFLAGDQMTMRLIPLLLVISADAVFFVLQWARLRVLCMETQDMRLYFIIALSSFAVFALIHFAAYFVCVHFGLTRLYTWLFSTAKLLPYAFNIGIGQFRLLGLLSAALFQLLTLATVFLAPLHRTVPDANERIPLDRDVREFKR